MPKCRYCRGPFERKVKRLSNVRTLRYPKGFPIEKRYCSYNCSRYDDYWRSLMPIWTVALFRWLTWKWHWITRTP